jgi:ABC-type nitrate/sulfonate/bicarbonate transport system ATPase subunit
MTYQTTDTLLKLENVSLSYGDFLVLRDIHLEVKDIVRTECTGQVVSLLGKSGTGKTQLFKLIAGMQAPTGGKVLITEKQVPVQTGIVGMVLQNYPLFEHRTLRSNLELVCNDKAKIDSYLAEFDIWEHRNKYPKQLSGGQRQRTAIVQQILSSDHFILLDEPYSGLDPVATEKLCHTISKVVNMDEQNTVIISTHVLEPALAISDTVWILGHEYIDAPAPLKDSGASVERAKIPGATIRYSQDLAAQGLAWNPEIRKDPRFTELVENIRAAFQTL